MEGALETADDASDFARAKVLDFGRATRAFALPICLALAAAFITGIAGFAKDAVCADSKSKCNNGGLGNGTGGGGNGRWLELAGRARGVLGTGGRNGPRFKWTRVFGKIFRSCSSDGSVLGAGKA